jgi:hypothetical protein
MHTHMCMPYIHQVGTKYVCMCVVPNMCVCVCVCVCVCGVSKYPPLGVVGHHRRGSSITKISDFLSPSFAQARVCIHTHIRVCVCVCVCVFVYLCVLHTYSHIQRESESERENTHRQNARPHACARTRTNWQRSRVADDCFFNFFFVVGACALIMCVCVGRVHWRERV